MYEVIEVENNIAATQEITKALGGYSLLINMIKINSIIRLEEEIEVKCTGPAAVYFISIEKNNTFTTAKLDIDDEDNESFEVLDSYVLLNNKLFTTLNKICDKHCAKKQANKIAGNNLDTSVPFIKLAGALIATIVLLGIINSFNKN